MKVAALTAAAVVVVLTVAVWQCWPHIRFWWQFEALGFNDQGCPEYRHRQTEIIFVKLPGGKFWMGAQKEDPEGQNYDPDAKKEEGPVHEVTLSPFLIAKFEVSQSEWKKVRGNNPSDFKGDHLPVESVSWDDCQEFCRKAELKLPSESQWEYTCRAGWSWPCAGIIEELVWYWDNSRSMTHPVGQKKSNAFGLHDMHGNVWEWCEDVYDSEFYSKLEASGTDPLCISGSKFRVVRGGGWSAVAEFCHSAFRGKGPPGYRSKEIGFRPVYPCPFCQRQSGKGR